MITKTFGSEIRVSIREYNVMSQKHKDFLTYKVFQNVIREVYANFEIGAIQMTWEDSGWVKRDAEYVHQIHVTVTGTEKERCDDEW